MIVKELRADMQDVQSTVTMRHRANEHVYLTTLASGTDKGISSEDITRIEHPYAIRAVGTLKYNGPFEPPSILMIANDQLGHCGRHGPVPFASCMRTAAWLYAVDGTGPRCIAHILRAILTRALPRDI
jgi:hypothetical protein